MIKFRVCTLLFALSLSTAIAQTPAQHCQNLICVRNNIDSIDTQIVTLIGERLSYVKRAGELKKGKRSVHDQARENKILNQVAKQAQAVGYPPKIATAVFRTLLKQANLYETKSHSYNPTQSNSLDTIKKQGILRVCTTGDYPPLTEYSNGKFQGEAISKAKSLAKYLGVKAIFIKSTWNSLSKDLSTGKCDIAMGGISKSKARAKYFLFSNPVSTFGKVPLVRCPDVKKYQTLKSINNKSVRVVENAGGTNEQFAKKNLPKAHLIIVQNNQLPFYYLLKKKADVMITDNIEATYRSRITPGLCAINPDKPFNTSYKVYMVKKSDKALLNQVNRWLSD